MSGVVWVMVFEGDVKNMKVKLFWKENDYLEVEFGVYYEIDVDSLFEKVKYFLK